MIYIIYHTHTHTHTRARAHTHTHTHTHVCMYKNLYKIFVLKIIKNMAKKQFLGGKDIIITIIMYFFNAPFSIYE